MERKILNFEIAVVWCKGNLISKKLVSVCAPLPCFNLLICSSERMLGVLDHAIFCAKGEKVPREALLMGWRSLSKLEAQTTFDLPLSQSPSMNILFWNCRGALNPRFQSVLADLINAHSPSIVIITETRIGGTRAKEITNRLSFDGAIHSDTIGYSGGIWVLWNSNGVEVTLLAKTEQEIHVVVKVRSSNFT